MNLKLCSAAEAQEALDYPPGYADREKSNSALSEVDQLLLRSDRILQRSQQDMRSASGTNSALQNPSQDHSYVLGNSSRSGQPASNGLATRGPSAAEILTQNNVSQEMAYQNGEALDMSDQRHDYHQNNGGNTLPRKSQLHGLLNSVGQVVTEQDEGATMTPQSRGRHGGLSKDLEHVQRSLRNQRSMEILVDSQIDRGIDATGDKQTLDEQYELLQEPDVIQTGQASMTGTQEMQPMKNFLLSNSKTSKQQESVQTKKGRRRSGSAVQQQLQHSNEKVRSNSNSRTRNKKIKLGGSDAQKRNQVNHKKGCPALASINALIGRRRTFQENKAQKTPKINAGSNSRQRSTPHRTRNAAINDRSNKRDSRRSSSGGLRATIVSRESKLSQSLSRSNSNHQRRSGRMRRLRQSRGQSNRQLAQRKVVDAASSPIRFDEAYNNSSSHQQQTKIGQGRTTMSITSSAAADLGFVAQTSYRSSIKEPQHQQVQRCNNAQQVNIETTLGQSDQIRANVIHLPEHQRSPNYNIFYSFKNSESTSQYPQNPHQQRQQQQFKGVQIEAYNDQSASSRQNKNFTNQEAFQVANKRCSTRTGAGGASSERYRASPGTKDLVMLGDQTSDAALNQARQALRMAQEQSEPQLPAQRRGKSPFSPNTQLRLNLELLKKREHQQMVRAASSAASSKQQINVRPLTNESSAHQQQQQVKHSQQNTLKPNLSAQLDYYLKQCESCAQFDKLPVKRSKQRDRMRTQKLNQQQKCPVCSMSAVAVYPGVQKAQKRVKERKFLESQKELVQHLRNPMSIAKQLRKHLKLQQTVKTQFNQLVGQAGRIAIQGLNKAPSAASCIQPLRQQHSSKQMINSSSHRWSDRRLQKQKARSMRPWKRTKKRDIMRLRYAPHLVSSGANGTPVNDAREAINIIVNERARSRSNSKNQRGGGHRSSHSRSRDSGNQGKHGAVRMHSMLSSDAKRVYGSNTSAQGHHKQRYTDSQHLSAEPAIESTICSRSMPPQRRHHQRTSGGNQASRAHQPYSERSSFDRNTSSYNDMGVLRSYTSSNPDYHTGYFHKSSKEDPKKGGPRKHKSKSQVNMTAQPRSKSSNGSQTSTSQKGERRNGKQWVRLNEILKKKNRDDNMTECMRTREMRRPISITKNQTAPRFETFNQDGAKANKLGKLNPTNNVDSKQQMDPVQSYSRSQTKSANSTSNPRNKSRSRSGNKSRSGKEGSRSSSKQGLQSHLLNDISRSASMLSQLSSRLQLASQLVSPQPQHLRSDYEDPKYNKLASLIEQDKSGNVHQRLEKAQELVETLDRGVKNLSSPVQSTQKDIMFTDPEPHFFSQVDDEVRSASKEDLDEVAHARRGEPRFGNQFYEREAIARFSNQGTHYMALSRSDLRYSSPDYAMLCANDQKQYPLRQQKSHPITSLRYKKPYHGVNDRTSPSDRRDDHSDEKIAWREQAERTFGYKRSLSAESPPRDKFIREVSGVKYDYRPPPPREYPHEPYGHLYGQYGGPSLGSKQRYEGQVEEVRPQARSLSRSQCPLEPLMESSYGRHLQTRFNRDSMSPEAVQAQDYERILRVHSEQAEAPYSRTGSHFRVKRKHSGSAYQQQRAFNTGVYVDGAKEHHNSYQAVTIKNENSRRDSKGHRNANSRDSKHDTLIRTYQPREKHLKGSRERAIIPKLKNFNDLAAKRQQQVRARRISFHSGASSDMDLGSDFGSSPQQTQQQFERVSQGSSGWPIRRMKPSRNANDRSRSTEGRFCHGHRCSASKEQRSLSRSQSAIGGKVRIVSKTPSRSRGKQQLMTVDELKDQIRRLQRPTFCSKMHEYRRVKPDPNELGKFKRDKSASDMATERPHCERDPKYWHRQVEGLATSFSQYPSASAGRKRRKMSPKASKKSTDLTTSLQGAETELMPLKKLKELSKVMNQIMDIDNHVQKLKSNLAATSEEIVRQINRQQSSGREKEGSRRSRQGRRQRVYSGEFDAY